MLTVGAISGTLGAMEFNDRRERPHRITPLHAQGHSLFPFAKPDFDSPTHTEVTDLDGFHKAVSKKTAKRYDDVTGLWKSAKVDRYRLDRSNGSSIDVPVGWKATDGYDPLR